MSVEKIEYQKLKKIALLGFEIEKNDKYVVIKLSGSFFINDVKFLKMALKFEVLDPYRLAFDCFLVSLKDLQDANPAVLREFVQMQVDFRKLEKKFAFIEVPNIILGKLFDAAVDKVLFIKESKRAALVEFGLLPKKALDVEFVNPFIEAVIHMLQVQCTTPCKFESLNALKAGDYPLSDVTGIIALESESFQGSIMLHFEKKIYLGIISRMLRHEYTDMNNDIKEGAAEMANIVLGQARLKLDKLGHKLAKALPKTAFSVSDINKITPPSPSILVKFNTDLGGINVQITTKVH